MRAMAGATTLGNYAGALGIPAEEAALVAELKAGSEDADADGFALPDGVASSAEGVQAARITMPARMSAAAAPSRSFMTTG